MTKPELKEISWDDAITRSSPHPYVLGTSVDASGKGNIIGLGWWTVCSWEPAMMAISVGKPRYSLECLDHCKDFVVCLVGEEHAKGAWICGRKSGRNMDKFKEAGFTKAESLKVKSPTIGESIVAFECVVRHRVETGDHVLFVGEVVAIRGSSEPAPTLFSLHYRKPIAIGPDGRSKVEITYK